MFMKKTPSLNEPCFCGSGRKYKKCCAQANPGGASPEYTYWKRWKISLKNPASICGIRKSGSLVAKTLDMVEKEIRPGLRTIEIDRMVHEFTIANGGIPAPLGYRGFPKSCCTSVNEVICHGIPGEYALAEGDIVNVDVTTILDGLYADASRTFYVGDVSDDARRVTECSRDCLAASMAVIKPGVPIEEIGNAIEALATSRNCSVVRDFVGHGIGTDFHEEPQILHYASRPRGLALAAGMVFTIEPMINIGGWQMKVLKDGWTAITRDGSLSAQFEHTVVVTPNGFEVLTLP